MELNFTEFDDLEEETNTHYDKTQIQSSSQKNILDSTKILKSSFKKHNISFDEILQKMNLKVNNEQLEYISNTTNLPNEPIKKNVKFNDVIDQQTKNSYIYNKYFKDYKDPNIINEPKPLMTRKDYIIKKVKDYINYKNEMLAVSRIKSTKLLFTNNNNHLIHSNKTLQNTSFVNSNYLFRARHMLNADFIGK
jgi:hypothetical protein